MPVKQSKKTVTLKKIFLLILISSLLVVGCNNKTIDIEKLNSEDPLLTAEEPVVFLPEVNVLQIPLPSPLADADAEISGMAWLGDKLVLLPQYPGRFSSDGFDSLFLIEKADLLAYVDDPDSKPIEVDRILFDDGRLSQELPGFEGFEAVAFYGQTIFVTIEASPGSQMKGYLVAGIVADDLSKITINKSKLVELPSQNNFINASDESILIFEDKVITIFEDNGIGQNSAPIAHVFDLALNSLTDIPMAPINFRITDATEVGENGVFFAMNYFFPGDIHLKQNEDLLVRQYGEGITHSQFEPVERIIAMKITDKGITLVDEAPLYLQLMLDNEARNWEGIVMLGENGFLIVTDKFPGTILGFVEILR